MGALPRPDVPPGPQRDLVEALHALHGQDLGNYRSQRVNQLLDRAAAADDLAEQAPIYQRIDARLGRDAAYIPLLLRRAWLLHGSAVRGYVLGPGYAAPDLGAIGVTGD